MRVSWVCYGLVGSSQNCIGAALSECEVMWMRCLPSREAFATIANKGTDVRICYNRIQQSSAQMPGGAAPCSRNEGEGQSYRTRISTTWRLGN